MSDVARVFVDVSSSVKLAWVGWLLWGGVQLRWYQRARIPRPPAGPEVVPPLTEEPQPIEPVAAVWTIEVPEPSRPDRELVLQEPAASDSDLKQWMLPEANPRPDDRTDDGPTDSPEGLPGTLQRQQAQQHQQHRRKSRRHRR
jgi:hypothetical protein